MSAEQAPISTETASRMAHEDYSDFKHAHDQRQEAEQAALRAAKMTAALTGVADDVLGKQWQPRKAVEELRATGSVPEGHLADAIETATADYDETSPPVFAARQAVKESLKKASKNLQENTDTYAQAAIEDAAERGIDIHFSGDIASSARQLPPEQHPES